MLTGYVTAERVAIVRITARGPSKAEQAVDAMVDTGFNGELSLPPAVIASLGLVSDGEAFAELADGTMASMSKYRGAVRWEGRLRKVIVLEADGEPVIGMSLLWGSRLGVDATDAGRVTITPLP